ncbi:translesion DNA synthesis-associated protein ImuA [Ramlibacter tataouinensis]|uniref:translesion DNA synthesis-associated protein ImuA n=1 Tax=Ramlibacter tataouinensis TaxID=94132 RepID=UPI0022F4076A|nr:translesion DNA synthesis-associated protein ImuA [Ramlibacter tataouinensis]WBY01504.1 translesion DNA synthesis-associated protein ImuA [Ramlibacter tataouinensis]
MQPAAALAVPDVWRVQDLALQAGARPSGHEALDRHLPGGGWPLGSLIELIQARPQAPVWQLVLPALAQLTREQPGPIALVGAPHPPFGPALAAQGLPADRLLWIRTDAAAARLWAAEQALRCADVAGLLAWLPQVRSQDLRRLHLAAGRHRKLLFVLRSLDAQQQASPAPLRLRLEGVDELQVRIVKRKGPPLEEPILLPAMPARLQALLASRQQRAAPAPTSQPDPRRSHVLDRLVTAA